MPGPSVWPLFAAIFTAGFFVLMTIQAYGISLACGVLAIPCVLRWLWETDRPVTTESADIGAGIRLPTYVTGPKTHGWWRSEEHTSELQSLMRISYAVFCLKKTKKNQLINQKQKY